jgi:hypothetical protein
MSVREWRDLVVLLLRPTFSLDRTVNLGLLAQQPMGTKRPTVLREIQTVIIPINLSSY